MHDSIRTAIAALTLGEDAQRHFDLAAEQIQRALLAQRVPEYERAEYATHAESARLVGGDYIDIFLSDDRLLFGLGDASGKSLAAALHALMLRFLVRGLMRSIGPDDLPSVVSHMNAVIADDLQSDHFITFLLGAYDPGPRLLRTVNAGHEPPLILRRNAPSAETIDPHGMVLGVLPQQKYPCVETTLEPGDLVVCYTDGLTEATNARGELFTIHKLCEYLARHRNDSATDIANGIFTSVKAYAQGELRDDATLFVMRAI